MYGANENSQTFSDLARYVNQFSGDVNALVSLTQCGGRTSTVADWVQVDFFKPRSRHSYAELCPGSLALMSHN